MTGTCSRDWESTRLSTRDVGRKRNLHNMDMPNPPACLKRQPPLNQRQKQPQVKRKRLWVILDAAPGSSGGRGTDWLAALKMRLMSDSNIPKPLYYPPDIKNEKQHFT